MAFGRKRERGPLESAALHQKAMCVLYSQAKDEEKLTKLAQLESTSFAQHVGVPPPPPPPLARDSLRLEAATRRGRRRPAPIPRSRCRARRRSTPA